MMLRYWILFLTAILLTACAAGRAADENITTEMILTSTPVRSPVPSAAPTLQPTPDAPQRLVIWWPDILETLNEDDAAAVLAAQVGDFEESQENVNVELRLKQARDAGGIMETLRTASVVAPGAMPDLTLIQRSDLIAAVQAGLIHPWEGRVSSAIIGDLHSAALRLGQVDGQLYGLPYLLEIEHLAYHPTSDEGSWRFESLLERDTPFVFPANRATGVNDVFLVQYLDAGGTFPEAGTATINTDALRATLAFYEQAAAAGITSPTVLDYSSPSNYRHDLASGTIPAAVVTSSLYLELRAEGQELEYGLIPTLTGQPATVLDGWMWVLTTADAKRQPLAMALADWMLEEERQGDYAAQIHMLPSQRTTLRRLEDPAYAQFVSRLLDNATLPLTETQAGSVARALQNALTAVLLGARTADQATQDVVDQLAG